MKKHIEWQVFLQKGDELDCHVFRDEMTARAFASANPVLEGHEGGVWVMKPAHLRKVTRYWPRSTLHKSEAK